MASSQASASDKFVNTKSLEEEFLQCVICSERFDQNTRSPKLLPCNHTFCLPCLKSVAKAQDRRRVLKCPTCRQEHPLGLQEIKQLPADHKIIRMMDFLSVAGKESDNVCHQHRQQPLSFFCKNCKVPVCRDCTVVSHKEAKGHEVIEITEAIKEFTPQFINTRDSTEEMSKKLQARSVLLNTAKEKLAKNQEKEKRRIQNEFSLYHGKLVIRENDLLSKLEQAIVVEKTVITGRGKEVDDKISAVTKLHEQYEEARKQQDVRQLFSLMHQMKEWEMTSTDLANGTDNDLQWYKYKPQNEDPFRKDVQELGNVEKMPDLLQQDFEPGYPRFVLGTEERSTYQMPAYGYYPPYNRGLFAPTTVTTAQQLNPLEPGVTTAQQFNPIASAQQRSTYQMPAYEHIPFFTGRQTPTTMINAQQLNNPYAPAQQTNDRRVRYLPEIVSD